MRTTTSLVFVVLALSACDTGPADSSSLREQVGVAIDDAGLSLTDAIAIAAADQPQATVVRAHLEIEHAVPVYDVELYADGVEYDLDVATDDGTIVDRKQDALDAKDAAQLRAAADLVSASAGWSDLIAAAESESGGSVFEVEADGDDGVLDFEALSDAGIYELEMRPDGTVTKSELSDDAAWEAEHEAEHAEDEAEDETEDETEHAEDETEHETEDHG
jgi:uncharacterized membrane protein YkoI